jgi:hypothetical protein
MADEAVAIGPPPAAESYLLIDKIVEACRSTGAQAVHPGYGFLAENAGFARELERAGVVWIGPPADAIDAMGSKVRARQLMDEAGVPIVPGVTEPVADVGAARPIAQEIGYPVAVKASSGGVLYPCTKKTMSSSPPGLGVAWATMASIHAFTPPILCDGRGICSPSGTARYEGALTDPPKVSVCESLLRTHKTKLPIRHFLSFEFVGFWLT